MATTTAAGADLSQVPALPPPTGDVSNFIDPTNRGPAYIAVAVACMALATFFVGIRLWVRLVIQRSAWWDDLVCVLALLSQATYCGLNIWFCFHGVGKHMWDVPALDVMSLITPARVMADVTEPSIGFTKLTLLLFYYRLFSPSFSAKVGSLIGMAVVVPVYTVLFFCFIFLDEAQTVDLNKIMAVLNVVSDFYILILPLATVLQLHVAGKKKLGLVALFSAGLFACIMSIVGAVYRFQFANDDTDFTWGLLNVDIVLTIEGAVGIVCACLPLCPAVIHVMSPAVMASVRSLREHLLVHCGFLKRQQQQEQQEQHDLGTELWPYEQQRVRKSNSAKNLIRNHNTTLQTMDIIDSMPGLYEDQKVGYAANTVAGMSV